MVIARSRVSALIEPLSVGIVCFAAAIFFPWIAEPVIWPDILIRIWFCFGGLFFILAGICNWRPKGIGLAFTSEGVRWFWHARFPFGPSTISWGWDDLSGARKIQVQEFDEELVGVLLELKKEVRYPFGPKWAKWWAKELTKRLREPVGENVVLLENSKWEWNPTQVAQWINESIADPSSRARWGTGLPDGTADAASRDTDLG